MDMTTTNESTTGKQKQPSDKRTIDDLAKMFGLPAWDEIDELNQDYYAECGASVAEDDPESDEEQELVFAAERAAQDEVFAKWHDAVMHAADTLFGHHDLELHALHLKPGATGNQARAFEFRIVPATNWQDAANKIRETINGVGYFTFATLAEFLSSGPYTARQAVLAHLGYIAYYPKVYGDYSARRLYDRSWS